MGRRGPLPQSDSLKALKGDAAARRRLRRQALPLSGPSPEPPDFLSERERALFTKIVASPLSRRIVADCSLPLARYCVYAVLWSDSKAARDTAGTTAEVVSSRHVTRSVRIVPFADMLALEAVLSSLEDKLGLNASSRQRLLADLATSPPTAAATVYSHEATEDEGEDEPPPRSPVGWGVN